MQKRNIILTGSIIAAVLKRSAKIASIAAVNVEVNILKTLRQDLKLISAEKEIIKLTAGQEEKETADMRLCKIMGLLLKGMMKCEKSRIIAAQFARFMNLWRQKANYTSIMTMILNKLEVYCALNAIQQLGFSIMIQAELSEQ